MDELIVSVSEQNQLDPDLVRAIAQVESSYNPWAMRFEPAWRYFYFPREHADRLMITAQTEEMMQATSWGLMQVMGSVARELGFDLELPRLCIPEMGLNYGCKKLKKLFARYQYEEDVIAAYNAGSPRKEKSGMYFNQRYVDKIRARLVSLRKIK